MLSAIHTSTISLPFTCCIDVIQTLTRGNTTSSNVIDWGYPPYVIDKEYSMMSGHLLG